MFLNFWGNLGGTDSGPENFPGKSHDPRKFSGVGNLFLHFQIPHMKIHLCAKYGVIWTKTSEIIANSTMKNSFYNLGEEDGKIDTLCWQNTHIFWSMPSMITKFCQNVSYMIIWKVTKRQGSALSTFRENFKSLRGGALCPPVLIGLKSLEPMHAPSFLFPWIVMLTDFPNIRLASSDNSGVLTISQHLDFSQNSRSLFQSARALGTNGSKVQAC